MWTSLFSGLARFTGAVLKPFTWSTSKLGRFAMNHKGLSLGVGLSAYSAHASGKEAVNNFYLNKMGGELIPSMLGRAGASIISGVVLGGLGLGLASIAANRNAARAEEVFQQVIRDPEFANADKAQLRALFNTIVKFSPRVASDPVLLKAYLKQGLIYGTVDVNTIKALQDVDNSATIKKLI